MSVERHSRFESLQWKLPLFSGAFLLVVLLGFATAMYFEIRRATLEAAEIRLHSLSQRLATTSGSIYLSARAELQSIQAFPEVRAYLRAPSPARMVAARAALARRSTISNPRFLIELRDLNGRVLVRQADSLAVSDDRDLREAVGRGEVLGAGPYRQASNSIAAPFYRKVGEEGEQLGYVVGWISVIPAPSSRQVLVDLIGAEGRILTADSGQTSWFEFGEAVSRPSVRLPVTDVGTTPIVVRYDRGEAMYGAAVRVPNLPWVSLVELPARVVLAPSDAFLRRLVAIAAVFVLLAFVAVWFFSRRLTGPLGELAAVADGFIHGERSRRVSVQRRDEIGTLATAFNRLVASTQEELVRREKLAVLGELAGGVGHELRNPLGVMTNAVYYLEAVSRDANPAVKEYLGILKQQIAMSDKIVGDLLDLARVKSPEARPVSLAHVVNRQVERVGTLNRIHLKIDVPESLPKVFADEVQVGQVVLNLLTNAVQSMEKKGGTLRIQASTSGGEKIRLDIADTGIGIPEQNMEKIFEPLFTTRARGMGLGLAVSRTLAVNNGGDITVQSRPGHGATFSLALPVAGHESSPPEEDPLD